MKQYEKIAITLTEQMLETIRDAVDSGEYASAGEVVREALRTWRTRRLIEKQRLDAIEHALSRGAVRFTATGEEGGWALDGSGERGLDKES